ncbi:T9SS type A sorting domain-containing protein [bacterium]|nr:T9SS type A sorting domain-containing protein [bacterium]
MIFRIKITIWLVLMLCQIAIVSAVYSATLNVPAVYSTIQAAIDAAAKGDAVLVSNGTYQENIDFKGKAITVKSLNGPAVTTIDGGGKYKEPATIAVTFHSGEWHDSVLQGFTITNAGTGVSLGKWASPSLPSSSPVIWGNTIYDNHTGIYGYVNYLEATAYPIIYQNVIDANWLGIGLDHQGNSKGGIDAIIMNNTIVNQSYCGIRLRMHLSLPIIDSNIIVKNECGIEFTYDSNFENRKALIWYNNIWSNTVNCNVDEAEEFSMTGIQGNISSNPLFLNETARNYHLSSGSLAIDAGNPAPVYNDSDDTRNDMGAFGGPLAVPLFTSGPTPGPTPGFTPGPTPGSTPIPTPIFTPTPEVTQFNPTPTLTPAKDKVLIFPNPAGGNQVTFSYVLDTEAKVEIKLYNVAGKLVAILSEEKSAGLSSTAWNIQNVVSGIYFAKIKCTHVSGAVETQKAKKIFIRKW